MVFFAKKKKWKLDLVFKTLATLLLAKETQNFLTQKSD